MRLIIEITYHSSALAVSTERFSPVDEWRGGRRKDGMKNNIYRRRRRYISWWWSCICMHARIDVRRRIEFYSSVHSSSRRTLISRFREIIRGGCVISFLVISCSTRRRILILRIFHSTRTCICVAVCTNILLFYPILGTTSDAAATTACAETDAFHSSFHRNCKKNICIFLFSLVYFFSVRNSKF